MKKLAEKIKVTIDEYGYYGILFEAKSKILSSSTEAKIWPTVLSKPVRLRTKSVDRHTYNKVFMNSEYAFDIAKSPEVIIDCGANIGLSAIWFANRYPDAHILAIEPESKNFALLSKNIGAYANIIPIKAALWNANTNIELVDLGNGSAAFRTYKNWQNERRRVIENIPGVTLDQIMQDYGFDFVDIVKIDIEGAEKEVFENSSRWIDRVGVIGAISPGAGPYPKPRYPTIYGPPSMTALPSARRVRADTCSSIRSRATVPIPAPATGGSTGCGTSVRTTTSSRII